MKPDWGYKHFSDWFFTYHGSCLFFLSSEPAFVFGVLYSFFVECFSNTLFTFPS